MAAEPGMGGFDQNVEATFHGIDYIITLSVREEGSVQFLCVEVEQVHTARVLHAATLRRDSCRRLS
jgi:hypothetical protein